MDQVQLESPKIERTIDTGFLGRHSLGSSLGGLALATLEAVCLAVIAVGHTGIALGFASLLATGGAQYWHADRFRIPVLTLSCLIAVANLYAVRMKWRLRNAPSAAWRKRPLSRQERLRMTFVVVSSMITLLVVVGEMWAHHRLEAR